MDRKKEITWLKREIAWLEEMIPSTTFDLILKSRIKRLKRYKKELKELEGSG